MKTAEGWYKLANYWQQSLRDMEPEDLTTFEAQLLDDLNRHIPDMEEEKEERGEKEEKKLSFDEWYLMVHEAHSDYDIDPDEKLTLSQFIKVICKHFS